MALTGAVSPKHGYAVAAGKPVGEYRKPWKRGDAGTASWCPPYGGASGPEGCSKVSAWL